MGMSGWRRQGLPQLRGPLAVWGYVHRQVKHLGVHSFFRGQTGWKSQNGRHLQEFAGAKQRGLRVAGGPLAAGAVLTFGAG